MNTEFSVIPDVLEKSKPIVTSTTVLRPHHSGTSFHCVTCAKPVAHWSIRHQRYGGEAASICALCFLYTSGWLVEGRVRRVQMVTQALALRKGKVLEFEKDSRPPKLVHVSDADDVLGAITLHDRVEANKMTMEGLKKALGVKP